MNGPAITSLRPRAWITYTRTCAKTVCCIICWSRAVSRPGKRQSKPSFRVRMVFVFPPVIEIGLCALVLTAAAYDLRWRRIPNWLAAAGLVFGVGLNSFLYEASGLRLSLLGMGLALAIYIPIYA